MPGISTLPNSLFSSEMRWSNEVVCRNEVFSELEDGEGDNCRRAAAVEWAMGNTEELSALVVEVEEAMD